MYLKELKRTVNQYENGGSIIYTKSQLIDFIKMYQKVIHSRNEIIPEELQVRIVFILLEN